MQTEVQDNPLYELGKIWVGISALVTAALYALGFVALRFHFQVLGVETEQLVIDTGYLAAGGRTMVWLLLVMAVVGIPMLLVVRLARPLLDRWAAGEAHGSRTWHMADEIATAGLVVLTFLMFSALSPADVLRQPASPAILQGLPAGAEAASSLQQLGLQILGGNAPGEQPFVVVLVLLAAVVELLTVMLTISLGRRLPGSNPLLAMLILTAAAGFVGLVGLHGVYFIPKRIERLTPAPPLVAGHTEQAWLVHRGAAKATLFYCTPAGERVLTTVPINDIDGLAVSVPQPIGIMMGVHACAAKAPSP